MLKGADTSIARAITSRQSVSPILVPDWQTVECFAVGLPFGHEAVHESNEAGVVRRFQQVDHLVNDDVFEAFWRLSSQIGV